jgi:hypothetical protein
MVTSITGVQSPRNFLLDHILFVAVVPKCLNCATFLNCLLFLYHDLDLRSGVDLTARFKIGLGEKKYKAVGSME